MVGHPAAALTLLWLPDPGGTVPAHSQGGMSAAVSTGETEVGEDGKFGPEKPGRASEPFPGGSAAAPAGSRVRVPPEDQRTDSAAGPAGKTCLSTVRISDREISYILKWMKLNEMLPEPILLM